MTMTAKDVKEISYMPLVTFFSVSERPGKNRKGNNPPPLVRRGLMFFGGRKEAPGNWKMEGRIQTENVIFDVILSQKVVSNFSK